MNNKPKPNRVLRPDGRYINVPLQRGQLFVCATGCCCGIVSRGYAPVPTDLYHQEWERRKLRNRVHLSQGGCLGPCPLANVTTLFFDGRFVGFQGVDDPKIVLAIFDYIDAMMAVEPSLSARVPLPALLRDRTFDYFTWSQVAAPEQAAPTPISAPEVQNDYGILFLTQADTDLLAMSRVLPRLPEEFPAVYLNHLNRFRSESELSDYLTRTLPKVRVVVARIHGGSVGYRLGFDHLVDLCRKHQKELIFVPGTADLDPELTALSTVPLPVIRDTYNYLTMGGVQNLTQMLHFLADNLMMGGFGYDQPRAEPTHGIYYRDQLLTQAEWRARVYDPSRPTVAILFYRAHWLTGNTRFIDALIDGAEAQGMNALPIFTYSLKEQEKGQPACFELFYHETTGERLVSVIVATMSFALGKVNMDGPTQAGWNVSALQAVGVPILQAIASGMEYDQWALSVRGLSPLDTAMNIALPEFDGRIATVPISFKGEAGIRDTTNGSCDGCSPSAKGVKGSCCSPTPTATQPTLDIVISEYVPLPDRIARVMGLARRMVVLQEKPNAEKRIALVLTNSTAKASRIGNAVGLDTPASLVHLLHALRDAGYTVGEIPPDGDTLIHTLIERGSYDVEYLTDSQIAQAEGVALESYQRWFATVPAKPQSQMTARWQDATDEVYHYEGALKFAGLTFGNVFVALQPPRGYGMDPDAIYHQPDLPPTHHYAAFYMWLRETRSVDAIVHMGKHGTLEWMPGKGIGNSAECYPDVLLDDLPLIYPFIVNDPGEGMQAKRRSHAVIIDHLMPPMTSAETYGDLEELQQLVDQYYQLEALDPTKLPLLQRQIWEVMQRANLADDLNILGKKTHGDHTHEWDDTITEDGTPVTLAEMTGKEFAHLMEDLDGYLCEIGTLQIRDGLHTLGHTLEGTQLVDMCFALTRLPNLDVPSLREATATALGVDLSLLLDKLGARFTTPDTPLSALWASCITHADVVERIDALCRALIATDSDMAWELPKGVSPKVVGELRTGPAIRAALDFIATTLRPALSDSRDQEIAQILHGLAGEYVPAGPSGAPTRGMAHILPTGRNFYAVDPRGIPNQTAWRVGQALADELLKKYLKEEGTYPERVGLSIWGTSAMRTHGDDLAECFALMGVEPVYQKENRRLVGVTPIPLDVLGRPRIDVLMRISGFFRDAFPHLIELLDAAVQIVAQLDEPIDQNFIRKHALEDMAAHGDARRATYRIFGSKPGSYGAGILPLIDEQNWQDVHDFAEAYVNWGGYAYTAAEYGTDQRDTFRHVLSGVAVAVKNQDNREHDIFDSDDYLQYHGGMIASIRSLTGRAPRQYFGDNSDPQRVQTRDLKEEARRVFRARVVNPKWLESIRRHGYKGGLELAATVDYLFGYDATAEVMSDWMYEQVADAYLFDVTMQEFLQQSNPWARKAIGERLLEAGERGMWENLSAETRQRLMETILETESELEGRQG